MLEKLAVSIVPIITPGSPPSPSLSGKPGIPSPNPNITQNNRGMTNADYVAKAPSVEANDGLKASTIPTEEKSMNKVSFMGKLLSVAAPTVGGAGIGYFTADEEDKLRNALIGGALGALVGGGVATGIHAVGRRGDMIARKTREALDFMKANPSARIEDAIASVNVPQNILGDVARRAKEADDAIAMYAEKLEKLILDGVREREAVAMAGIPPNMIENVMTKLVGPI
jgi:hypothetical protein